MKNKIILSIIISSVLILGVSLIFILNPNNKKENCEHINTEWKILEESTCEKVGSKELYCK